MMQETIVRMTELSLSHLKQFGAFDIQNVVGSIIVPQGENRHEVLIGDDPHKKIGNYLVDNGFAVKRDDIKSQTNAVNAFYIELTKKGRLFKKIGTLKGYNDHKKKLKNKKEIQKYMIANGFYVQLLIMIWTGMAALYYALEILKNHFEICPIYRQITFVFLAIIMGYSLLRWYKSFPKKK